MYLQFTGLLLYPMSRLLTSMVYGMHDGPSISRYPEKVRVEHQILEWTANLKECHMPSSYQVNPSTALTYDRYDHEVNILLVIRIIKLTTGRDRVVSSF